MKDNGIWAWLWLRAGRLALLAGLLWIGVAGCLDGYGLHTAPAGDYDAIVVLGCRVGPGGRPSPALSRRARHAVRLWQDGWAPGLVFTGGVGEHGPAEARVAAALAGELGVPEQAILLEELSTSTDENAEHAAAVLGGAERVLVVTDSYHVFRSERVFSRRFGDVTVVGSKPWRSARLWGSLREVWAVLIYAVLGRLT